jgi:hypothetical protein
MRKSGLVAYFSDVMAVAPVEILSQVQQKTVYLNSICGAGRTLKIMMLSQAPRTNIMKWRSLRVEVPQITVDHVANFTW